VFAVRVEGCPLDSGRICVAPVEILGVAFVGNAQLTSFVRMGQANNKGAELGLAPGGVDVRFEFSCRSRIDLKDLTAIITFDYH
jgi:hypothetical protein